MFSTQRKLASYEQPEQLHRGLQNAVVVEDRPTDEAQSVGEESVQRVGVPHGIRSALVLAEHVRVSRANGRLDVYFCDSDNYRVLASTIQGQGDDGPYPATRNTRMKIKCRKPRADGYYPVRMRVSVNGSVEVEIEGFDNNAPLTSASLVGST